jgi:hypothetical protein
VPDKVAKFAGLIISAGCTVVGAGLRIVTMPLFEDTGIPIPAPEVPIGLRTCRGAVRLLGEFTVAGANVALTTATTPGGMSVLFNPSARHRIIPVLGLQTTPLLAAMAADPGTTCKEVKSAAE